MSCIFIFFISRGKVVLERKNSDEIKPVKQDVSPLDKYRNMVKENNNNKQVLVKPSNNNDILGNKNVVSKPVQSERPRTPNYERNNVVIAKKENPQVQNNNYNHILQQKK